MKGGYQPISLRIVLSVPAKFGPRRAGSKMLQQALSQAAPFPAPLDQPKPEIKEVLRGELLFSLKCLKECGWGHVIYLASFFRSMVIVVL